MKKHLLLLLLFSFKMQAGFAQFSLYNTRTLYDSFENPAQKAFYADSSRTYAFNFFIPNLSLSAVTTGPAQTTFKGLLYKGTFNTNGLELGESKLNKVYFDETTYVAMFKIFKSVRFNQELGFSWQIKSTGRATVSNEALALFNNYKLLTASTYDNLSSNSANGIAYHQFGFTFREDYNKRLGLGIKLSYLSGIVYSKLDIDRSSLSFNEANNTYAANLQGYFRSNILYDNPDKTAINPGFQNPGVALTLSANYKLKRGFSLLGNLKDLGFIHWRKSPYKFTFDHNIEFSKTSRQQEVNQKLRKDLLDNPDSSSFNTEINSRAEILINKDLKRYQPNLLISKNLFDNGGDIALINTYRHRALNLSVSTAYNLNNYFQLGGQFMLKSPNAELFIGSDQLYKSYYTAKGILTSNENIGKNHTAAGVYFGFSLKYGQGKQRQQNATYIPLTEKDLKEGFFKRMFKKIFGRKRFEGL